MLKVGFKFQIKEFLGEVQEKTDSYCRNFDINSFGCDNIYEVF